jgi:hypothetical protein
MLNYVTFNVISKLVVIYLVLYGICGLLLLILLDTFSNEGKTENDLAPPKCVGPLGLPDPNGQVGRTHPICYLRPDPN